MYSIGVNLGDVSEDYFYHSLDKTLLLGGVQYDSIAKNVKGHKGNMQGEFDLVMYNGDALVLIETKHKVHPNDLVKLKTEQMEKFRILFPIYAKHKITK